MVASVFSNTVLPIRTRDQDESRDLVLLHGVEAVKSIKSISVVAQMNVDNEDKVSVPNKATRRSRCTDVDLMSHPILLGVKISVRPAVSESLLATIEDSGRRAPGSQRCVGIIRNHLQPRALSFLMAIEAVYLLFTF